MLNLFYPTDLVLFLLKALMFPEDLERNQWHKMS